MQLEHSFTVPVPVDEAWKVLLDIEQIAPCMPGAILDSVDGDDFTGRVRVKLGPISLTYKGKASFVKKDEASHTAVIDAAGKDQRGNGTAAATVTASLKSEGGSSTRVDVLTDLNITGKPAQFGRGVMVDVGNKLIGQFATCVEGKLSGTQDADGAGTADSVDAPVGAAAAVVAAENSGVTGGTSGNTADSSASTSSSASSGGKHSKDRAAAAAGAGDARVTSSATGASTGDSSATGASTGDSSATSGASGAATPSAATKTSNPRPRAVPAREPEPIDLLEVAGGSVLTRIAAPAAGLAVALLILLYIIRKIRS